MKRKERIVVKEFYDPAANEVDEIRFFLEKEIAVFRLKSRRIRRSVRRRNPYFKTEQNGLVFETKR
uniref:Uncharacterized protein n=1 Tax=Leptospira ellisii TaxID=2023197 RepID=A0A2N0BBK7_9LEPT|nr:hypothetical protein CH379_05350 [Leptospira ellisii]